MKERAIMFQNRLLHWAKDNLRDFPWRSTNDPYKICIAEILLHQTFARKVVPAYEVFIKSYPDVKKLHNARIRSIEKIIYPLGFLYRAKKLKDFAKTVVNEYGGRVPHYKEELLALPGVGEYTSSAVLCFAYDEQIPIIDANVIRVYSRLFEIACINTDVRKDGIVQKRQYRLYFNTILAELFVHNLLTRNYDWVNSDLYNLPPSAQVFYRRFLLHHNYPKEQLSMSLIIREMNFTDKNMTNLVRNLEMNTLNPLVRRGLILSYEKLEGLNEEKYVFVLPGKKKQEKEQG